MFRPIVAPRIEEAYQCFILWVERGNVASFIPVTFSAGKREVGFNRRSIVFARNNVVDVMAGVRIILMEQTIFAMPLGTDKDQIAQRFGNQFTGHEE